VKLSLLTVIFNPDSIFTYFRGSISPAASNAFLLS
jgi:hypothetical protein